MRAVVLVSDKTMLAVPLKSVLEVKFQTVPVPERVHVFEPILNVPLANADNPTDTAKVTASNVPDVRVSVRVEPRASASASCTVPVEESMVTGHPNVTPLLVIVWVPRPPNVIVPVALEDVTPVPKSQLP